MSKEGVLIIMFWVLGHVVSRNQPSTMNRIIPITDTAEFEHLREELRSIGQLKRPTNSEHDQENNQDKDKEALQAVNNIQPNIQILLKLYASLQEEKDARLTVGEADTVRTFSAKISQKSGKTRLTFHLRTMGSREVPQKVELRMGSLNAHTGDRSLKIRLSLRKRNGRKEKSTLRIYPNEHASSVDVVVDISQAMRKMWRALGTSGRRNTLQVTFRSGQSSHGSAVLVMFSQDKQFFQRFNKYIAGALTSEATKRQLKDKRSKRNSSGDLGASSHSCSLQSFELDFDKLGWNRWIINPKSYTANLCRGTCHNPAYWEENPTNHGVLLSYLRLSDKSIPALNCVPTKLTSMSMLYHEDGTMVMREHRDMVARECGCR